MTRNTPPIIMTMFGKEFDLVDPQPEQFDLIGAIHASARLSRFNGHYHLVGINDIYSVAQHACYVHDLLILYGLAGAAAWGLLHDLCEAYYGVTVSPLKNLFPQLSELEEAAATIMRREMDVPYDKSIADAVDWADKVLGCAESFALKGAAQARRMYGCDAPPICLTEIDRDFRCWTPAEAIHAFKIRLHNLRQFP